MMNDTIIKTGGEQFEVSTFRTERHIIDGVDGMSHQQLKSIVERIERLEEDKAEVSADIKEVYAEAKASGFDVKILRKVISLRKKSRDELQEEEAITDLYMSNLGMI